MVFTGPYKMLKKLHKTLIAKSNKDIVLISNGMFTQEGFPMKEAFVDTNKVNFQCESRTLNFNNSRGAADEINEWIKNKTKGRRHLIYTQSYLVKAGLSMYFETVKTSVTKTLIVSVSYYESM